MHYSHLDEEGWPICNGNQVVVPRENCSPEVMHYKYSVRKEFSRPEDLLAAGEWANRCCTGPWVIGCIASGFMTKEDAMHFKLTWM